MIFLYRFCCRIRISGEYDEEMPGGDFLGVADVNVEVVRERFASLRLNNLSDWYTEGPELTAYVRSMLTGRGDDLRRRLVDTEAAMLYTGRSRSTLYRWSDEGRLTRYGPAGRPKWDVLELPARTSVGPAAAPTVRTVPGSDRSALARALVRTPGGAHGPTP